MSKLRLLGLLAGLSLVFSASSTATPPTTASGSFTITALVTTGVQVADGRLIVHHTSTIAATGTLTGTEVCNTRIVIDPSSGNGTFYCNGVFTGTVEGAVGTIQTRREGRIVAGVIDDAHWTLRGGTGGLDGLHGQGTFDQIGLAGTYEGSVHFDPST